MFIICSAALILVAWGVLSTLTLKKRRNERKEEAEKEERMRQKLREDGIKIANLAVASWDVFLKDLESGFQRGTDILSISTLRLLLPVCRLVDVHRDIEGELNAERISEMRLTLLLKAMEKNEAEALAASRF